LPAVPAPVAVSGAPTAVAAALVKATADSVKDTTPVWLAAYRAFGVPVIDRRVKTKPADPVGPFWSQVWSVGQISRNPTSFWGTDAVRILTVGAKGLDQQTAAKTMLADLRADAASADPGRQTFARFLAGKLMANGGADPLVASTTAEATRWDPATTLLARWVLFRQWLRAAAAKLPHAAAYQPPGTHVADLVAWREPAATPNGNTPCSNFLGSEEATTWGQWIAGKIGGGFPGFGGLIQEVLAVGGTAADKAAAEIAGWGIAGADAVAGVISLIAEVSAAEVNLHWDTPLLKRNKKPSDGEGGNWAMTVEVYYDFPKLDQDNPTVCALSAVANALGVGFTMPVHRAPLAGAELVLEPGKNVPDKVLIDTDSMKYTLDSDGMAQVKVKGARQPKDLPNTAREVQDEFGLKFSAQPEPETVQSLLNTFLDSASLTLTLMGAPVDKAGVLGGMSDVILDILKTMHYNIDEQIIPFTDFRVGPYTVTGHVGPIQFSGIVDDIEKPFTLQVSGDPTVADTALLDPKAGTITGSQPKFGTTVTTKGTFALTETNDGYTASGTVKTCIVIGDCRSGDLHLTFTPLN
jgi:hypothetical protein